MQQKEVEQIRSIILNIEEKKWYIPYWKDLETHPTFGPVFQSVSPDQKIQVQVLINEYITERIDGMTKTKWGQLFKRFFDAYNELFRKFRTLNESETPNQEFQQVGKQIEQEMFKLEWILTDRMLKQEKGLDKVIDSFYKIVYTFFPRYNKID